VLHRLLLPPRLVLLWLPPGVSVLGGPQPLGQLALRPLEGGAPEARLRHKRRPRQGVALRDRPLADDAHQVGAPVELRPRREAVVRSDPQDWTGVTVAAGQLGPGPVVPALAVVGRRAVDPDDLVGGDGALEARVAERERALLRQPVRLPRLQPDLPRLHHLPLHHHLPHHLLLHHHLPLHHLLLPHHLLLHLHLLLELHLAGERTALAVGGGRAGRRGEQGGDHQNELHAVHAGDPWV
jgi:hypothetical protein